MAPWSVIGVVAGALVSVLVLVGIVARTVAKIAAPHFATAVKSAIEGELATIRYELRLNGGESMKDVVNEIRRDLKAHLSQRKLDDSEVWQAFAELGYDRRGQIDNGD